MHLLWIPVNSWHFNKKKLLCSPWLYFVSCCLWPWLQASHPSPSYFILLAPPHFLCVRARDHSVSVIWKACRHGSGFHGNTFQTASLSVLCFFFFCIFCSDSFFFVRDTEVCSISWACILTICRAANIKNRCVFVWLLGNCLKVIRAEVGSSCLGIWMMNTFYLHCREIMALHVPLKDVYMFITEL